MDGNVTASSAVLQGSLAAASVSATEALSASTGAIAGSLSAGSLTTTGTLRVAEGAQVEGGELVSDADGNAEWREPPATLTLTEDTQYQNTSGRGLLIIVGEYSNANGNSQVVIYSAPDTGTAPGTFQVIGSDGGPYRSSASAIVPPGTYYDFTASSNVISAVAQEL